MLCQDFALDFISLDLNFSLLQKFVQDFALFDRFVPDQNYSSAKKLQFSTTGKSLSSLQPRVRARISVDACLCACACMISTYLRDELQRIFRYKARRGHDDTHDWKIADKSAMQLYTQQTRQF